MRSADGADWIDVLDLGARAGAASGWVLGRLVPSGVDTLTMFDQPPLAVSEDLARAVASVDDWCSAVTVALTNGLASEHFLRDDYEMGADVQELDLIKFGTAAADLARVMQQLRSGRDEGSRAAYRILERARRGDIEVTDQAYVAAATLFPQAYADAHRQLVRPGEYDVWAEWAALVVEPARSRLLGLAEAARASA